MNADGLQKLSPLVIRKAQKPRAFKNKTTMQLSFNYRNNAKAWMTSSIYQEWLLDWDRKLRNEGRKVLFFQDNFSGHIVPDSLTNISAINFEPNLTVHVQLNDQGIIRCFKANYRAKFIQCAVDLYESGTTPSQIYDINQLEAMRLADSAWSEVDTITIQNCWRKAGILPDAVANSSPPIRPTLPISVLVHNTEAPNDPISDAEKLITTALDNLETTGALQRSNHMDIAELLNPIAESLNVFNATDNDIFEMVMAAKAAQEANSDGSNEVANSDNVRDAPTELVPTRQEVLQAAAVLRKYVNELDDLFARKLEMMLGSFGQRTWVLGVQNMKDNN